MNLKKIGFILSCINFHERSQKNNIFLTKKSKNLINLVSKTCSDLGFRVIYNSDFVESVSF
jgi:hypothetical protein